MDLSITEALQEISTLNKRIETKRQNVLPYLARDCRMKDPFAGDGGTIEYLVREMQSIHDMQERIVTIRTSIQRANLTTGLVLHGVTRTVAEWLTWRKEIAQSQKTFLSGMINGIRNMRSEYQKKGFKVAADESTATAGEIVVMINEKELLMQQESLEHVLGDLDGKLSLLNATTLVAV